ncbi:MAG TPA: acyltransferase family protein [Brevundimonas sp.]|jgi:peptidoglycan/LPS O-acetylase OafA/YrhL|uniref:acyltransferase family protein n=1 Tax=Brevundimonas sp. TaxID=1871086 RepID=UPI002E154A6D|nr:acyltransferase family protein [Brevundimonas sp.]
MNRNLSIYLDLVRLAAAIGVFLSHAKRFVDPDLSKLISTHGPECVALFFVLSGFVIRHATVNRGVGARSYALARLSRMWSVAIPAVAVTALFDAVGFTYNPAYYASLEFWNGPANYFEIAQSLSFLNEAWGARVTMGTNDPFWSLGYEVAYYILFLVTFIKRRRLQIAFFLAWTALFGPQILAYGALWGLGIVAYDVCQKASNRSPRPALWIAISLTASPALYPIFKYIVFPPLGSPMRFESISQWAVAYVYYLMIGLLVALHFVGCAIIMKRGNFVPARVEAAIRWAAGATFTIYLMHQPIIVAMAAINERHPSAWLSGPGGLITTLICLFLLAEAGERRKRETRAVLEWLVNRLTVRTAKEKAS